MVESEPELSENDDDDDDVILRIVEGDDESFDEACDVIPTLRTVTRHGRLAGSWRRNFQLADDSDSDADSDIGDGSDIAADIVPSEDRDLDKNSTDNDDHGDTTPKNYVVLRSGRRAGYTNPAIYNK